MSTPQQIKDSADMAYAKMLAFAFDQIATVSNFERVHAKVSGDLDRAQQRGDTTRAELIRGYRDRLRFPRQTEAVEEDSHWFTDAEYVRRASHLCRQGDSPVGMGHEDDSMDVEAETRTGLPIAWVVIGLALGTIVFVGLVKLAWRLA